jgi:hypothetical protein
MLSMQVDGFLRLCFWKMKVAESRQAMTVRES